MPVASYLASEAGSLIACFEFQLGGRVRGLPLPWQRAGELWGAIRDELAFPGEGRP